MRTTQNGGGQPFIGSVLLKVCRFMSIHRSILDLADSLERLNGKLYHRVRRQRVASALDNEINAAAVCSRHRAGKKFAMRSQLFSEVSLVGGHGTPLFRTPFYVVKNLTKLGIEHGFL
jgi:hypothetical protein